MSEQDKDEAQHIRDAAHELIRAATAVETISTLLRDADFTAAYKDEGQAGNFVRRMQSEAVRCGLYCALKATGDKIHVLAEQIEELSYNV